MVFYFSIILKSSHSKSKTNYELLLLTVMSVKPETALSYSSVPKSSIVGEKL